MIFTNGAEIIVFITNLAKLMLTRITLAVVSFLLMSAGFCAKNIPKSFGVEKLLT